MREAEFRDFLHERLGARTVDSYVSNCNRVRKIAGVDLDIVDCSEVGLSNLRREIERAGVPPRSASDCMSAVRAYADFRAQPRPASAARSMQVTHEQREAWVSNTKSGPFNRWLDALVRDEHGGLDLERLHAVAQHYGIDRQQEYAGLNPGQQRMNLGNMLRVRVPRSVYEHVSDLPIEAAVGADEVVEPVPAKPLEPTAPRPELITGAKVGELLALYGQIMDELRARNVVRTGNSPVGDYAELLFARAFDWRLEGNSSAGYDAMDGEGRRYQIKGRRLGSPGASRQLSAIRRLQDNTFDYVAAVLFDPSFKVSRALILPHDVVVAKARRTDHTNSWTLILDDRLWQAPGARDATAEVAVAAAQL